MTPPSQPAVEVISLSASSPTSTSIPSAPMPETSAETPPPARLVGIELNPGPLGSLPSVPPSPGPTLTFDAASTSTIHFQDLFKDGLMMILSFLALSDLNAVTATSQILKRIVSSDRTCRQVTIRIGPKSDWHLLSHRYLSSPLRTNITKIIYETDTTILSLAQLIRSLPALIEIECTFTADSQSSFRNWPIVSQPAQTSPSKLSTLSVHCSVKLYEQMKTVITDLSRSLPNLAPNITALHFDQLNITDCAYLSSLQSLTLFSTQRFDGWSWVSSTHPQSVVQPFDDQFLSRLKSFICHNFTGLDYGLIFQFLPSHPLPLMIECACGHFCATEQLLKQFMIAFPNLTTCLLYAYDLSAWGLLPGYKDTVTSFTASDHTLSPMICSYLTPD